MRIKHKGKFVEVQTHTSAAVQTIQQPADVAITTTNSFSPLPIDSITDDDDDIIDIADEDSNSVLDNTS